MCLSSEVAAAAVKWDEGHIENKIPDQITTHWCHQSKKKWVEKLKKRKASFWKMKQQKEIKFFSFFSDQKKGKKDIFKFLFCW